MSGYLIPSLPRIFPGRASSCVQSENGADSPAPLVPFMGACRCAACSALTNERWLIERLRLQQPAHAEHQIVRLDIVERHCGERIPRHQRRIEVLQDPRAGIANVEITVGELDREVR